LTLWMRSWPRLAEIVLDSHEGSILMAICTPCYACFYPALEYDAPTVSSNGPYT
jgi:hypothetical protein